MKLEKKFYVTFCFVKVFLHWHHLTFSTVLWPRRLRTRQMKEELLPGVSIFLNLSSLCCHPLVSWPACSLVLNSHHHFDTSVSRFKTDLVLLWETVWHFLKKIEHRVTIWPSSSLLDTYLRVGNISTWRLVHKRS